MTNLVQDGAKLLLGWIFRGPMNVKYRSCHKLGNKKVTSIGIAIKLHIPYNVRVKKPTYIRDSLVPIGSCDRADHELIHTLVVVS